MNHTVLDVEKCAVQAEIEDLQLPAEDGRYNTLNETGAMHSSLREIDKVFIEIACKPKAKVLEIGPAYGLVCMEALRRGATNYIAIDIEEKHLNILAKQIMDKMPSKKNCVTLIHSAFPSVELRKIFEQNSFDAIHAANVFSLFK